MKVKMDFSFGVRDAIRRGELDIEKIKETIREEFFLEVEQKFVLIHLIDDFLNKKVYDDLNWDEFNSIHENSMILVSFIKASNYHTHVFLAPYKEENVFALII